MESSLPALCVLAFLLAGCGASLATQPQAPPSPDAGTPAAPADAPVPAAGDAVQEWRWSSQADLGDWAMAIQVAGPAQSCRLGIDVRGEATDRDPHEIMGVAQAGAASVRTQARSANPSAQAAGVDTMDVVLGGGAYHGAGETYVLLQAGEATAFWAANGVRDVDYAGVPADAPTFEAYLACPQPFQVTGQRVGAGHRLFGDLSFEGVGASGFAAEASQGSLEAGFCEDGCMLAFTDRGALDRTLGLEHAGGDASWRTQDWQEVSASAEDLAGPVTLTMDHKSTLGLDGSKPRPSWLNGIVVAWRPVDALPTP